MKLIWYGHSCFGIYGEQGSAVFDPYSPNCVPGLDLPPLTADTVICSHLHKDHGYAQAVTLTGRTPRFSLSRLESFHDDRNGTLRGMNTVTAADIDGMRVVHMGDLGHFLSAEQIMKLGKVDVLLIPVGGYYTIDSKTAASLVKEIKPRITVPMHYRGKDFGYDVISTVDEFASLSENVRRFDTNELEITENTETMTAILKLR